MTAASVFLASLLLVVPGQASKPPPDAPTSSARNATQVASRGVAALARATEALLLDRHESAANEAFRALSAIKPSEDKYESAEFILAEALAALGLDQASAEYYFSVASRRQNVALLPRALEGLQRLVRRRAIDEDRLFSGVLIEADVASLDADMASFMAYHLSLIHI